jgi:polysaccharide deacetylase family protein (PEP-CTERM system associated)
MIRIAMDPGESLTPTHAKNAAGLTATAVVNALSFDVEDYFQVQALADICVRDRWDAFEPRVERNTNIILDLLAEHRVHATFFTLGWVAERFPAIVRRIVAEGHELASHGYAHLRVDGQTPREFRADISRTKTILEQIAGIPVFGYRAATFSLGPSTPWAFNVLEDEGYNYSSSVYPVAHDNYSNPHAPRFAYRPAGTLRIWEFPISTLRLGGRNFPCGGGGYFRFAPYTLFRRAISHINRVENRPAVFYLHPWEVDPEQPRPAGIRLKSRLRHYMNLRRTLPRLTRLLRDFSWDRIDRAFSQPAARAGLPSTDV